MLGIEFVRVPPPEPPVEFSSPPTGDSLGAEPFVEFSTPPVLRVEQAEATPGSEAAEYIPTLGTYPLVVNGQVQHFLDRFTRNHRDVVNLIRNRPVALEARHLDLHAPPLQPRRQLANDGRRPADLQVRDKEQYPPRHADTLPARCAKITKTAQRAKRENKKFFRHF